MQPEQPVPTVPIVHRVTDFEVPQTFEECNAYIDKVLFIFQAFIEEDIPTFDYEHPIQGYKNMYTRNNMNGIIPHITSSTFWYTDSSKGTRDFVVRAMRNMNLNESSSVPMLFDPIQSEEEYFQYSTLYTAFELFCIQMYARTNAYIKDNPINFKSAKIVHPVFADLYDSVYSGKKPKYTHTAYRAFRP